MLFIKKVIIAALTLVLSTLAFSQEEMNYLAMEPVKFNIKRRSKGMNFAEFDQVFQVSGNKYLYVRSYHTSALIAAYHKVNAFLFDSKGKLLKSNLSVMKYGEIGKDRILKILHFGEKVLVITYGQSGGNTTCKFWDITEVDTPQKIKEVSFQKSIMGEWSPEIKCSETGNFLMIVSGHGNNLVVIDKDFETVYSKNIIPSSREGGNKDNILDGFDIDDEGYVSLSIFLREEAALFHGGAEGVWLHVGIDMFDDEIKVWSFADVWSIDKYDSGFSKIKSIGNGKVMATYEYQGLKTALFDIENKNIIDGLSLKSDKRSYATDTQSELNDYFSVQEILSLASEEICMIVSSSVSSTEGDYVIFYDINGKFIETKRVNSANRYDINTTGENLYVKGDEIIYKYACDPADLAHLTEDNFKKEALSFSYSDNKMDVFFRYNMNSGARSYLLCRENDKVKPLNRELKLTDQGIVVYFEFKGSTANLFVHDLKTMK